MTQERVIENELRVFIDQIGLQLDGSMIRSSLDRLSHACGFESFAYVCTGGAEPLAMSTYPLEWQSLYEDNNFCLIDPVVQLARRYMRPVRWSSTDAEFASDQHQQFFAQAAGYGVSSGLTIPVPAAYGRFAMLTLASSDPDLARTIDLGNPLSAVTAAAFVHVNVSRSSLARSRGKKPSLTTRQLACLSWASLGKTMPETSVLLGISPNTVRFYLEEAKDRLGAVNLPHAVRLAVQHRLI